MGDYAFLNASPFDQFPTSEAMWEELRALPGREWQAKYLVPVLWLALFEPADLRDGPDGPYLIASQQRALAILERRRANLAKLVGKDYEALLGLFADVVANELRPYVLARLGYVELSAPAPRLVAALTAVAELDRGPISAAGRATLVDYTADWRTSEHSVGILSGHARGWPPTGEELTWRQAMARASAPLCDWEPTTVWKVGDRICHLMFGDGVVTRVLDGNKTEVLFRSGPTVFARASKAVLDPYGEATPIGRFLRDPADEALWLACREAIESTDRARATLMDRSRATLLDLTDEGVSASAKRLIGPLARVIDPHIMEFRRGFLSNAWLHAPYEIDRRSPFLRNLGRSGELLLHHPLWRTVEDIEGEDDDVILLASHPNLVSLHRIRISAKGLSRLSRLPEPVRIKAATSQGGYGLDLDRAAWAQALRIGSLTSLSEVTLNARGATSITPAEVDWLLAAPLGKQLRTLVFGTDGATKVATADWIPALTRGPLERIVFHRMYKEPKHESTLWFVFERVSAGFHVRIATDARFTDGLAIADTIRETLAGLPRTTRATVAHCPLRIPPDNLERHLDDLLGALHADLEDVTLGSQVHNLGRRRPPFELQGRY